MAPRQRPSSTGRRPTLRLTASLLAVLAGLLYVIVPASSGSAAPRSTPPSAQWELLGTVPGAASQPTAVGRRISALQAWHGRVYAGYGDWGANTGPITLSSIAAGESSFRADAVLDTEAVETIRPVGDQLVVPATDPRNQTSDYAIAEPWVNGAALGAMHVFDTATLTGDDLWLVGSRGNNAVAWRSLDGGTTWAIALDVPPSDPASYARFYFAGVLGGRLYLQSVTASSGAERSSRMFDGVTWSTGPSLLQADDHGRQPEAVGGSLLYLTEGGTKALRSFDGRRTSVEVRRAVDIARDGDRIYVLTGDGSIKTRSASGRWITVAASPAGATSVAAADGVIYAGTSDSTVFALKS